MLQMALPRRGPDETTDPVSPDNTVDGSEIPRPFKPPFWVVGAKTLV